MPSVADQHATRVVAVDGLAGATWTTPALPYERTVTSGDSNPAIPTSPKTVE